MSRKRTNTTDSLPPRAQVPTTVKATLSPTPIAPPHVRKSAFTAAELDDIETNGRNPLQLQLANNWVSDKDDPTGGTIKLETLSSSSPPPASSGSTNGEKAEGTASSSKKTPQAKRNKKTKEQTPSGEESVKAKQPKTKSTPTTTTTTTTTETVTVVKKRTKCTTNPECVNLDRVNADGTLMKSTGSAPTAQGKAAKSGKGAGRRDRLSMLSQQRIIPVERPVWKTPDLRPPIEVFSEVCYETVSVAENSASAQQGSRSIVTTRENLSFHVAPQWLDTDAISGLSSVPMAQHSGTGTMGDNHTTRVLPMSDFVERFTRQSARSVLEKVGEIVGGLYAISEARYARRIGEAEPSRAVYSSEALLARVLSVPDYHERITQILQPTFDGESFTQHALPDVPLLLLTDMKPFLRPPDFVRGERQCSRGLECSARSANIPDLRITGPLQWTPSSQRPKKHRDETTMYVLREFLLPHENAEFERTGRLPEKHHFCLLCTIQAVNCKYYDSLRRVCKERDWNQIDPSNPLLALRPQDIEYITEQLGTQQLFQVRVCPGEFSEQSVLAVEVGGRRNALCFPFPLFERLSVRWTETQGQLTLSLTVQNF